jgi:hypothetical protein
MGDGFILGEDLPLPPAGLFERLAQVPGYTWDHSDAKFSLCPSTQHTTTGVLLPLP